MTLLELLRISREYITEDEGFVLINYNESSERQFRKIKHINYLTKHRLLSPDNLVENRLIEHILNETIDDVISQLPQGEKRDKIEEIREKVSYYFDKVLNELIDLFIEKNQTERKEFALKYKEHPYFGVIMKAKEKEDLERLLKEKIIRDTSKLSKARDFLEKIS